MLYNCPVHNINLERKFKLPVVQPHIILMKGIFDVPGIKIRLICSIVNHLLSSWIHLLYELPLSYIFRTLTIDRCKNNCFYHESVPEYPYSRAMNF